MLVEPPPPIFDFEPTTPYAVMYAPADEMPELCGGRRVIECTHMDKRIIIVWDGLSPAQREQAARHGRGHLNGWRH